MLQPPLSKDQKALYYSLLEGVGIKDLKTGNVTEHPDTSALEQWLDTNSIQRMVGDELGYHFKFLKVPSKPYIVYAKGKTEVLDLPILGIVGPRNPSNYAQAIMQDFFAVLSKYRVATISGGAPGVDTMCHALSLQYGIPTIVVLGGGFGHYLQQPKRALLQQIVDGGGLVLSEFKLKQTPTNYTFPQRNRIIAGLADTLFVPAAGQKSGSLITVDFARQIHTTVYTVPASIHEVTSAGSNTYLAEGKMRAVVNYQTMLDTYFDVHTGDIDIPSPPPINFTTQQAAILTYLQSQGSLPLDAIATYLDIAPSALLADITLLEMSTCIREERPGQYIVV